MIKNYNLFLLNEGVTVSNEDIVDIIKSLESEDNKNATLIKKLVNTIDNKGKSVLMNIVQSNNEELIDYVLKYNVDINHKNKNGENVLFYCKSLKIFNKFYDLGADVHTINTNGRNILTYLSSKKIYDEEAYQKLINDGVDVNQFDKNGCSVLTESILTKKIVLLLIKNNVNLNDNITQELYLKILLDWFRLIDKKRKSTIDIFTILFKNGMKILNEKKFIDLIYDVYFYRKIDIVDDFIKPLINFIPEDIIIKFFIDKVSTHTSIEREVEIAKKLLNLGLTKLYYRLKKYYSTNFEKYFSDIIKENPHLEDAPKYNL